jgi:G3E family GTPase
MKTIPSLMFIGGFLGAGKTTAIRALGKILKRRGISTAAITNDQADGLVDTAFLADNGFSTQEVAGSCFCCNFDGLLQAITKNIESIHPDIILAEPVGSCTDLVSTVIRPMLDKMNNKVNTLAFSVLVEPLRWIELVNKFDEEIASMKFLFDKQLEEADYIVITKTDTLTEDELNKLLKEAHLRYPDTEVLSISAKERIGLEKWLDLVQVTPPGERWLKEIDYDEYAEAEADMGWLNAQLFVKFPEPVDGNAFSIRVADNLRSLVVDRSGHIGNLKILVVGRNESVKCGMSHAESKPQLENRFAGSIGNVNVTINVRATLSPDDLSSILSDMVDYVREKDQAEARIFYLNTFRPAPPNPTYRYDQYD